MPRGSTGKTPIENLGELGQGGWFAMKDDSE
jgi:hypothetical protein